MKNKVAELFFQYYKTMNKQNKLTKFDVIGLVIGSVIGWGSFSLPGLKFLQQSGVINTAIGLFVGGLAIVFIQKGYHTMLSRHQEDGGEFSYTYKYMGKPHGFIVGWSLILCYLSMIPLNATAFILVVKKIFGDAFSVGYLYTIAGYEVYLSEIAIASSIILLFAYINKKGVKISSRIQNIMAIILVLNVTILFIFMVFKGNQTQFVENYVTNYQFSFPQIAKIIAIIPFLFVGFDVIPQVSTDLNFKPSKATSFTILGIVMGILVYNFLNTLTGLAYSPSQALSLDWATGSAVTEYVGNWGFIMLVLALLGAVIGGINGFMLSSSRLVGALSANKMMPPKYHLKNKHGVLNHAITFVIIVSLICPWLGREVIIYIVDMASVLAAVAYAYVCYIGFKYTKQKNDKFLTFIGLLVSISFIGLLLIPGSPGKLSNTSLMLLGVWIILGYFYFRWAKKQQS